MQVLRRDDGSTKNVQLIEKRNVHNNRLQVMNQYAQAGTCDNRYDVTILVNGLPLVHVERRRRGGLRVVAREAVQRSVRKSMPVFARRSARARVFPVGSLSRMSTFSEFRTLRACGSQEARKTLRVCSLMRVSLHLVVQIARCVTVAKA